MQDKIVKVIELKAPISRVWRALVDYKEFGAWFRVDLDGPFEVGKTITGQITYPGYEHMRWESTVEVMDTERLFVLSWPVSADESGEPEREFVTRGEFKLEKTADGTRLTITESGFSKLPDDGRREDAYRRNTDGWNLQAENIKAHVDG